MKLNLAAFEATPVSIDPYPYAIVPGFLSADSLAEVARDFPSIAMAGSLPVEELSFGPAFQSLLTLLGGDDLRRLVERKFDIDLSNRPVMVTVRARARPEDGKIHKDSRFKLITLLLYLNESWDADGGRLRLLRSADNLDDVVAEVPPVGGTLLAFRCTDNAWHGHKPVDGPRRSLQLNYVADEAVRSRELARHRFSAKMKKVGRFFGIGRPGRQEMR